MIPRFSIFFFTYIGPVCKNRKSPFTNRRLGRYSGFFLLLFSFLHISPYGNPCTITLLLARITFGEGGLLIPGVSVGFLFFHFCLTGIDWPAGMTAGGSRLISIRFSCCGGLIVSSFHILTSLACGFATHETLTVHLWAGEGIIEKQANNEWGNYMHTWVFAQRESEKSWPPMSGVKRGFALISHRKACPGWGRVACARESRCCGVGDTEGCESV